MTRRIALAILLTVWTILIAGCITAYATVRWALINELDQSLIIRASSLPELVASSPSSINLLSDHYLITTDSGRKLSKPGGGLAATKVDVISRAFSSDADGDRFRILTLRATIVGIEGRDMPVTIVYQGSAAHLDRMLTRLAWTFSVFGIVAGLITALVALRVSRTSLKPLHATAEIIGTIEPANLDRRIDIIRLPVELVPMADKLNQMLDRIERAYVQRQQFLADASHELRTPVAAMVTTLEVSLRKPRDAESYKRTLTTCLEDAQLLRVLVEKLMEQCRADTLSHDETPAEIDLSAMLLDCARMTSALGERKNINVNCKIEPGLVVSVQAHRLRSIVTNLLSNAVEYNREGGEVTLSGQTSQSGLIIQVSDNGHGIKSEHIPFLFEPFFRADRARSGETGHMGLGLSLVQSHVRAMNGSISVESQIDVGTIFTVSLPIKTIMQTPAGIV